MKSKWEVKGNTAAGDGAIFLVQRMNDGETEYYPKGFENEKEAQAIADNLNIKHWRVDYSVRYKDGVVRELYEIFAADTISGAETAAQATVTGPISKADDVEEVVIWAIGIMEEDVF